jgi:2-iminobutanoate/2-iminopropanoate deaminase
MKLKILLTALLFSVSNYILAAESSNGIDYIKTTSSPAPFGAYSQGVAVDLQKSKLIFVAGQVAKDPKTLKTYENDIELATRQTLDNINAILKAAGTDLNHAVRIDVFLRDLKDWRGMNKEFGKHFESGHFPVRQAVQVGMVDRIEMSCIAYVPQPPIGK